MGLTAGIIGLPNVGKSTLFNAITNSKVEAANYPFATINPNSGTVMIVDERIDKLTRLYNPQKKIYASFEFTDIAGLVKGASKGEGLGNQFLANIREVDAICHVVRCFDDEDIIHVDGSINPTRDIDIVNLELVLADQDIVEKRLAKIEKKAISTKDANLILEAEALKIVLEALKEALPARICDLTTAQNSIIKSLNLLTFKPIIYVANMADYEIADYSSNKYYQSVLEKAKKENTEIVAICARLEEEISVLNDTEKEVFLDDLNIKETGLNKLVKTSFKILGLSTFFTCGDKEVKAWTFKAGSKAPVCAGIIHSDFETAFIKAEIFTYDDIIRLQTENAVKEAGKFRIEGKDYIVKDGDIVHFRVNV